jgi:hypothetical protein
MIHLANSVYHKIRIHADERLAGRAYYARQSFALVVFLICGYAGESFAAAELNVKTTARHQAIPVGQQQTGLPLKLHGVFEGFNPDTRKLTLTHLAGMAFSWAGAMRDIDVDRRVNINALEPGMPVTAILTRMPNGQYCVTGLVRS